jgi:hypothetical protein
MLVIFGGAIAVLVVWSLLFGRSPGRERRVAGGSRGGLDYGAMSEVESHDVDDMLEAINAYRRRAGRREVGEELADEVVRGTWDGE